MNETFGWDVQKVGTCSFNDTACFSVIAIKYVPGIWVTNVASKQDFLSSNKTLVQYYSQNQKKQNLHVEASIVYSAIKLG